MSTINKINSNIPIEISKGGTQSSAFTNEAVVYYDGTQLQSVAGATAGNVLTSQGTGSAPFFVALPTFFPIVAGDPASPSAGDTWYNSNTNQYRGAKTSGGGGTGAWVIEASLSVARIFPYGAGTSGADVTAAGGQSTGVTNITERYDGISNAWSTKANITTSQSQGASAGTASDLLIFGGVNSSFAATGVTQEYNGGSNSWTTKSSLNLARLDLAGCGSSSSALAYGGNNGGTTYSNVELYNGTSWSNVTSMPQNRHNHGGNGNSSSALAYGGLVSGVSTNTCVSYNGTTWSSTGNLSAATVWLAGSGASSSSSLSFGGGSPDASAGNQVGTTESFNGTSWSAVASMNIARGELGGAGSSTDALSFGGTPDFNGNRTAAVERFNFSSTANVTFTLT